VGLYCKDCEYFKYDGDGYGECKNQRLSYIDPYQFPESDDMLIYWDSEYYMATMMVGQYFGCVHFSRRE